MLVAFVSLRDFTLHFWDRQQISEKYFQFVTKVSRQALHLEFFTIRRRYNRPFRRKRVNANWVVCY